MIVQVQPVEGKQSSVRADTIITRVNNTARVGGGEDHVLDNSCFTWCPTAVDITADYCTVDFRALLILTEEETFRLRQYIFANT